MANITLDKLKTIVQSIVASVTRYKPNLAVNDPDDPRYVAGRLCYKTVKAVDDVPETTVAFVENEGMYASTEMLPIPSVQAAGDVRTVVWDGVKYVCKAADYADGMGYTLGNLSILAAAMGETAPDTGEPFVWMVIPQYGVSALGTADTSETHTVRCYGEKEVIHELPQEYLPQIPAEKLPDLGLANVAYSGSYNDLDDKPTIPTDMVLYTAQNLTTTQKAQARTNIGAGTSSFDGAYSSLTGAPALATVATSGSYNDLTKQPLTAYTRTNDTAAYTWDGKPGNNDQFAVEVVEGISDKEWLACKVSDEIPDFERLIGGKTIDAYYSTSVSGSGRITKDRLYITPDNKACSFGAGFIVAKESGTYDLKYTYYDGTEAGYTAVIPSAGVYFFKITSFTAGSDRYTKELYLSEQIGYQMIDNLYLTDPAGAKWQLVVGTDGTLSTTAATE